MTTTTLIWAQILWTVVVLGVLLHLLLLPHRRQLRRLLLQALRPWRRALAPQRRLLRRVVHRLSI